MSSVDSVAQNTAANFGNYAIASASGVPLWVQQAMLLLQFLFLAAV